MPAIVLPTQVEPAGPSVSLLRITRMGHALLDAPTQIVEVTATGSRMLAATPAVAAAVPAAVVHRIARSPSTTTVVAQDGTTWTGTPVDVPGAGVHVALCAHAESDAGRTRAAMADLAALATDVLRLAAATAEAEGLRELLGTASHDLRNPLSVLRAGLETLTLHGDELPPGQGERIAELAVRQARRMEGMIDGLLSLHGLIDGQTRQEVDLGQLVLDAAEAGRLSHDEVDFHVSAPVLDRPVLVHGVADPLARLLTNLVTNAAVHGGGRVWVTFEADDATATVRIADDGDGMPRDTPLTGADREHTAGGHGLGLVIARRIVAAHDGTIVHRDRDGGGTIIEVTVPRLPSA